MILNYFTEYLTCRLTLGLRSYKSSKSVIDLKMWKKIKSNLPVCWSVGLIKLPIKHLVHECLLSWDYSLFLAFSNSLILKYTQKLIIHSTKITKGSHPLVILE